jgi:hypothetical protein
MPVRLPNLIRRVRSWPRRLVVTLAVVAGLLLAARLALPAVVKNLVNDRLQRIPGYTGYVNDIDVALWRGAYRLQGFGILRKNGTVREPFFLAKQIDFSIAWREVWHGKIVSFVHIDHGQLNFVKGSSADESQTDLDHRWQDVIQDIFPIDITRLEITDGLLRYVDTTREPNVNVFVTHMRATATGLRNHFREGKSGEFPAKITLEGDSLGAGKLKLLLAAEPLAAEPHFHLSLELDHVNLPALNQSLRAYANVDVGRGTFRLVAEMAGRDGGFQGYVKPFFENLDFKNVEDKDKGIGSQVWEHVVAGLTWLVKNKERNQVATRSPFEGKFGDSKVGLFATITNLFRHGFIRAFNPIVEGSVRAENVLPSGKPVDGKSVADNPPKAVPDEKKASGDKYLQRRLFSLATVIVTGFLLLVSLVASAMLSWLCRRADEPAQHPTGAPAGSGVRRGGLARRLRLLSGARSLLQPQSARIRVSRWQLMGPAARAIGHYRIRSVCHPVGADGVSRSAGAAP